MEKFPGKWPIPKKYDYAWEPNIEDVAKLSRSELKHRRNLGKKSRAEIEQWLHDRGFYFSDERVPPPPTSIIATCKKNTPRLSDTARTAALF
jgi:hypothetical protein